MVNLNNHINLNSINSLIINHSKFIFSLSFLKNIYIFHSRPVPQTVYVQQQPQKKEDSSMCLGCLAAMCFCCALDAIF
ncbi:hypothetical protein BDF21DRAFT_421249 [Thamnidium elegans]|nr:hypothetical protein BDF21DRAFT_421249 [Thamnidium elegans]